MRLAHKIRLGFTTALSGHAGAPGGSSSGQLRWSHSQKEYVDGVQPWERAGLEEVKLGGCCGGNGAADRTGYFLGAGQPWDGCAGVRGRLVGLP